jgi:hypothetical protein
LEPDVFVALDVVIVRLAGADFVGLPLVAGLIAAGFVGLPVLR